jgi:hypothetical protein
MEDMSKNKSRLVPDVFPPYFIHLTNRCGPDITAHGSLDLKQEIQIKIQTNRSEGQS